MRVMPVGETRRRLPELIRKVASGGRPVVIGRRGKAEVVLTAVSGAVPPIGRKPLAGLIEVLAGADQPECASPDLRRSVEESLRSTARFIAGRSRQ